MSYLYVIGNRWLYLRRIWDLRFFWLALVQMDLRTRYRRSFFGIGWSLLRPLAMSTVLCLVFSKLFDIPAAEYAPFLLLGLSLWQFFVESTLHGCECFLNGAAYVRQQPVPLAIFPLRTTLGVGLHCLIALLLALALAWIFRGIPSVLALAFLIPALILFFFFGWFMSIIGGLFHCHFPDTKHLFEIGIQILFYLTPIIYRADSLRNRERFLWAIELNPLTHMLELVRRPILDGSLPPLNSMLMSLGFVAVIGIVAVLCLKKLEKNLIFWL